MPRHRRVIRGEIHEAAKVLRDSGLVCGVSELLVSLRGDDRSSLLDLLIESHPAFHDGGTSRNKRELTDYSRNKLKTLIAVYVEGESVQSMARLTLYGTGKKIVGILSTVVTRESVRGKGFAKSVVGSLMGLAQGIPIRLSVAKDNRVAQGLYESLGFVWAVGGFMEK